jgi:Cu/Ag efflux pump CusA
MIERTIDWCASNRFLVFTGTAILTLWGIWAMTQTPLDAVPDISDVQVIVSTEWMGRSPDLIEDQITYPIVSALISTPISGSRTSTSSSRMAPTSIGRAAAWSSTSRASAASCRKGPTR